MIIAYADDCIEASGLSATGFADVDCKTSAEAVPFGTDSCDGYLVDTLDHPTVPVGRKAGKCTCYNVRNASSVPALTCAGRTGAHVGGMLDGPASLLSWHSRIRSNRRMAAPSASTLATTLSIRLGSKTALCEVTGGRADSPQP